MLKNKLMQLTNERDFPSVTISLNTHRRHPENTQDRIALKNLCNEAEKRLIDEFGKREVASILESLEQVPNEVDENYNLDSLHIFLSKNTKEIVRSILPTNDNVHIGETFYVQPLISAYNRSSEYLILLLSQGGVKLFEALNDSITREVENEDFPFDANPLFRTDSVQLSDSKSLDNLVREYLNNVDKALIKVHQQTDLKCVVICTEDNYSRLMQVADRPDVYYGYANINYNQTIDHQIASQAWELIQDAQNQQRTEAVNELQEAISQNKVLTDLGEIYKAAKEGRGDLLLVQKDFRQAAKLIDDNSIELLSEASGTEVSDDIAADISWEIISKKGRVVYIDERIPDLGDVALKVRY